MFVDLTTIAIIVLALLGASILVILLLDRARIYDHIARSAVQLAIALATVFVAYTIYEAQVAQRKAEELEKERRIVLSFLRSTIFEIQSGFFSPQTTYLIRSPEVACHQDLAGCQQNNFQRKPGANAFKNLLTPSALTDLNPITTFNRGEVWQIMRLAPQIKESYFTQILEVMRKADSDASFFREDLKLLSTKASEFKSYDDEAASFEFAKVVAHQSQAIAGMNLAICSLNNLHSDLSAKEEKKLYVTQKYGPDNLSYDAAALSCAPYSDDFDHFKKAWKASTEREFKEPEPKPKRN